MAVSDAVQFQQLNSTSTPPLRGIVQVAGPPEEVLWSNGTRTVLASRGGTGSAEVKTITDASGGDFAMWSNRRVQFADPASAINGGNQARGIIVDVYLATAVLNATIRRDVDGLYYVTDVAGLVIV